MQSVEPSIHAPSGRDLEHMLEANRDEGACEREVRCDIHDQELKGIVFPLRRLHVVLNSLRFKRSLQASVVAA